MRFVKVKKTMKESIRKMVQRYLSIFVKVIMTKEFKDENIFNDDFEGRMDEYFNKAVRLTNDEQNPNISGLWWKLRNVDNLNWNVKNMGYLLAKELREHIPIRSDNTEPSKIGLVSKPSTQKDMESTWCEYWSGKLNVPVVYHRKMWELTYIPQVLFESGMLEKGKSGIGFGCGEEPLPSLFASYEIDICVTDLDPEMVRNMGWAETSQHTSELDKVYMREIVSKEDFEKRVHLEYVDMNNIPDKFNEQYDFCWSVCALEHLGSIQKGLDFIINSMDILKSGGVAIHTTEFNYMSENDTIDNWVTVLFLKKHFQQLEEMIKKKGFIAEPFDYSVGNDPLDKYIDLPPYDWDDSPQEACDYQFVAKTNSSHLKLSIDGFASTCYGIIIRKP